LTRHYWLDGFVRPLRTFAFKTKDKEDRVAEIAKEDFISRQVRLRTSALEAEKLIGQPRAVLLRAVGWGFYAFVMTDILIFALSGDVSWVSATALMFMVASSALSMIMLVTSPNFSLWFAFGLMAIGLVGRAVGAGVVPIMASVTLFGIVLASFAMTMHPSRTRSAGYLPVSLSFPRALCIVFGRVFLYFPAMPFLRAFDVLIAILATKRVGDTSKSDGNAPAECTTTPAFESGSLRGYGGVTNIVVDAIRLQELQEETKREKEEAPRWAREKLLRSLDRRFSDFSYEEILAVEGNAEILSELEQRLIARRIEFLDTKVAIVHALGKLTKPEFVHAGKEES
jgi:hypothetical protein